MGEIQLPSMGRKWRWNKFAVQWTNQHLLNTAARFAERLIRNVGKFATEKLFSYTFTAPTVNPTGVDAEGTGPDTIMLRWNPVASFLHAGEGFGYDVRYDPGMSWTWFSGTNLRANPKFIKWHFIQKCPVRNGLWRPWASRRLCMSRIIFLFFVFRR